MTPYLVVAFALAGVAALAAVALILIVIFLVSKLWDRR